MSATHNDDLACQQLAELVTDYLEDGLPAAERGRFEAHLASCSGCRTCLEQMRVTIRWLGRLSDEAIEPEAKQRLLAAFRDWRASASTPSAGQGNGRPASGR